MIVAIILAVALAVLLVLRYTEQSNPGRLVRTGPDGKDPDGDSGGSGSGPGVPK